MSWHTRTYDRLAALSLPLATPHRPAAAPLQQPR
eukprot:CAMPEP_0119534164 /NCGR_PEP_ID=MMETSP1344-20130328/47450_1 /TAXON_ID=236787 /ORGANISM="Florenciella parvula, Strain CCMP2471" /LENGTH=33 /DNA_ID= /DNA_START= /DNA_END= /DNA_ORIENTATION=